MTSCTIYINGRFLMQPMTGVQRYAYEMCKALRNEMHIVLLCPKNGKIKEDYDVADFNIIRYGIGSSHVWEQLVLPLFFIGKHDYLLISFTGLGSVLVPNKIMTVHDLSFLAHRQWFSRAYYYYYKPMTWLAVRTSKHIITVSEFSKSELLRFYPFLKKEKVNVIYNAVDGSKFHSSPISQDKKHYFLTVSSLDPRKNIRSLIEAFRGEENCKLKIVGGRNKVFAYEEEGTECGNVEFLGRVTEEELLSIYSNADAFILPSLYEGFGLPLVEAMAIGCPVMASDIPVFREVCEDAAIYFNPNDIADIKAKIRSVGNYDCQAMVEKGKENVKRFSWQKSASKLVTMIKDLRG